MNRLISVLVTLFLLFLVYLWINHITRQQDPTSNHQTETTTRSIQPEVTPTEQSDVVETPSTETVEAPDVSDPEPEVLPKKVTKKERPQGNHMVIAGNFLERGNAEKHLNAISGLGFDNAEILEFEISEYYTVCAGRYSDLNEARQAVRRIKELPGMDAYVRNSN